MNVLLPDGSRLDLIFFSGHKALLTSTMHLASVSGGTDVCTAFVGGVHQRRQDRLGFDIFMMRRNRVDDSAR